MKSFAGLSLRWNENELQVLDQTLLPDEEKWISIRRPEEMADAILALRVRGAPLIGVAAGLALADSVSRGAGFAQFEKEYELLRSSRPTAVNLMWVLDQLLQTARSQGLSEVPQKAWDLLQEDVELCERIARRGEEMVGGDEQILTHCNTGALATAGVGTALGIIRRAHERGKRIHVWVDETRPLLQGGRLTTYELEKLKIPYTLICDNMAATLMAQGKINRVIVGADRIASNGDFANKIGTYSVAVNAHHHRIPFWVAAPWSTVDLDCSSGKNIPIEERSGSEVRGVRGSFGEVRWAPKGAPVFNPAFDVTPSYLVEKWILDRGVLSYQDVQAGGLTQLREV